jgi:hypothetical protein
MAEPMRHIELIQMYNEGHITGMEFVYSIFQTITKDNVEQVYADIPDELKKYVVDRLFISSDGLKTVRIECVVFSDKYTVEDHRRRLEEEDRKYREGITALREHLGILPV